MLRFIAVWTTRCLPRRRGEPLDAEECSDWGFLIGFFCSSRCLYERDGSFGEQHQSDSSKPGGGEGCSGIRKSSRVWSVPSASVRRGGCCLPLAFPPLAEHGVGAAAPFLGRGRRDGRVARLLHLTPRRSGPARLPSRVQAVGHRRQGRFRQPGQLGATEIPKKPNDLQPGPAGGAREGVREEPLPLRVHEGAARLEDFPVGSPRTGTSFPSLHRDRLIFLSD